MKNQKESVRIDTFVYATSVSETERIYSVPLKLAAQDYEFNAGASYAVTVDVHVNGITYSLDASTCGEGHRPDLSLETYTWSCISDNGEIIQVTADTDGKTLHFTSPESGSLRNHWFDGAYSLTIPHEYGSNEIVIGNCYIEEVF